MVSRYKIADQVAEVSSIYDAVHEYCADYRTDEPADYSVSVTQADIDFERQKSDRELEIEGTLQIHFSDAYLEGLAVYRKIAEKMIDYNTMLFHGSVVAVDGVGYLFTAKSGTGKSTHTRLWRTYFGERAVMVNDDKPLIKVTNNSLLTISKRIVILVFTVSCLVSNTITYADNTVNSEHNKKLYLIKTPENGVLRVVDDKGKTLVKTETGINERDYDESKRQENIF